MSSSCPQPTGRRWSITLVRQADDAGRAPLNPAYVPATRLSRTLVGSVATRSAAKEVANCASGCVRPLIWNSERGWRHLGTDLPCLDARRLSQG